MSYISKSVHEVIKEIDAGKFYLPALQRKFVWDEDRILLLFDSIIRGYPISTFLFWFLKKERANDYVFYKFLDRYDERDPYNKRKDGLFTQDEIIGILDGQQRLSAIYIGLQGKFITRSKHKHKDNPDSYPERTLFINLFSTPYILDETGEYPRITIDENENFEFKFLALDQIKSDTKSYWFRVGEIIKWNEDTSPNDIYESFMHSETNEEVRVQLKSKQRQIIKTLENLRDKFIKEQIITYFKTNKDDLESILNIFVRVNSGAMALSPSDLLFSTIIATWENGREEIESLQKKINSIGEGFNFSNDFIMRCLLVLSDLPVLFKVNSFKNENVKLIKDNWNKIKSSLTTVVTILAEAGLNQKLISSQNAVIPIAYYVFKGGKTNKETKPELIKYLKRAFLNNIFGNQGDAVLAVIRNTLRVKGNSISNENFILKNKSFILKDFISNLELPAEKSLNITEDILDKFINTSKGSDAFLILSLIYPNFKYDQVILHQDHIHPLSGFTKKALVSYGLDEANQKSWISKRDTLPNLQLMEGRENQSKNSKPFKDWLDSQFPQETNTKKNRIAYLESNYIGKNESLDFKNFNTFYNNRAKSLKNALKLALEL